jgi:hypothetical protein
MTLSLSERAALRQQWLAEIDAEIERRQATIDAAGGDPREQLLAVLEQMGQRMRAARDWIEPSADEKVQLSRQVNKWFAENGYYDPSLHCHDGCPPSGRRRGCTATNAPVNFRLRSISVVLRVRSFCA